MRSDVYINSKPDETLKGNLLSLFKKINIAEEDKLLLAKHILIKVTWRENSRDLYNQNPPTALHLEKLDTYIESLNATRKAWLALPLMTKEILPEMIPEIDSSLLPWEATSKLSSVFYSDKSNLPPWRLTGLSNLERWGSDLEMIDLMRATAMHWKDNYLSNFGSRRDSTHIGLIAGIAELCIEHGIKISYVPRSYFVQILMLVFPNLASPRASIKEAIKVLKI
ncbi:hypothetical protein [Pseudomonas fluorescens]|uniref:hypothetical protein n=1 Tax=Pseudomonas fluorescens TaxID=294 RepID=UPI00124136AE|nr:hypothetical protein [Pseudomonas fluorescens]VVO69974.1 hypothetical protein PS898_01241 [Pseudomonas fluorescens]